MDEEGVCAVEGNASVESPEEWRSLLDGSALLLELLALPDLTILSELLLLEELELDP